MVQQEFITSASMCIDVYRESVPQGDSTDLRHPMRQVPPRRFKGQTGGGRQKPPDEQAENASGGSAGFCMWGGLKTVTSEGCLGRWRAFGPRQCSGCFTNLMI